MAQVEAECHGQGASAFLSALANMHMCQAIRHSHRFVKQAYQVTLGVPIADTITAALRIMQTHPEKHWTVKTLALEVGLSRASFAAKFSAKVGLGPMEYLTELRMKSAADMLRNNAELPLWEIGRRIGYTNEGSFARSFKMHFGKSPRAYSSAAMADASA